MASEAEKLKAAIQNQRIYQVGASPLVWGIMETLGIEELTDEQCPPGDQTISHGRTTVGMVLNRLIKPKAMYKVGEWLGKTGLADWLGHPAEEFNDDRLGRTLDAISDQTEELWLKIVGRALKRYPKLAGEFIHYDLTSCYFEGKYAESKLAEYGYSRDHRPDTKQINLGVSVIGESKLPLMYELLAGNTTDCKTPLPHVTKLKRVLNAVKYPHRIVLVGDRAMFNQELIEGYLKEAVLFLGPWTPPDVRTLMQAVTTAELMDHPLSFQPQSARADDPPTYYGVLRTFDFATDDPPVPLQVLIVYSRGKAKLDRQLRDNHLDQVLTRRADIQTKLNRRRYKHEAYVRQQLANMFKKAPAAQPKNLTSIGVRVGIVAASVWGIVLRGIRSNCPAQRATSNHQTFSVVPASVSSNYRVPSLITHTVDTGGGHGQNYVEYVVANPNDGPHVLSPDQFAA